MLDACENHQRPIYQKYAQHFSKPNSNGETALEFFLSKIDGRGVYFLDEPENSLSPSFLSL